MSKLNQHPNAALTPSQRFNEEVRARVVEHVHRDGVGYVVRRTGLAREQVLAIAAGVAARPGTILRAGVALGLQPNMIP